MQNWGAKALVVSFPFARVRFGGLSSVQVIQLEKSFSRFLRPPAEPQRDVVGFDLDCQALRLAESPDVSREQLTFDGQYSPILSSKEGKLEITGFNFYAQIDFATAVAEVSVKQEWEFATDMVIENFLRIFSAHFALQQGGILLHSAGFIFDRNAYIFVGKSGSGKTTLTRKAHNAGAEILSDDINMLLPRDKGYVTCSVPFTGEFGRTIQPSANNSKYPVAGLVLLEHWHGLSVEVISSANAISRILAGTPFVNQDRCQSDLLLDRATSLVQNIPVINLKNSKSDPIGDIMGMVTSQLKT